MHQRSFVLLMFATAFLLGCKDEPEPLKACFEAPASVEHGTPVTFSAGCSANADSFHWYFGDGGEALSADFTYTYLTPGIYQARLIVDKAGLKDSVTHTIQVIPTAKESSCLPVGLRSPEIWPYRGADSVSLSYLPDKKLSEMTWWDKYITASPSYNIKFNYNENGKPSKLEVLYFTYKIGDFLITYDDQGLPLKAVYNSADQTFVYFEARFEHNVNGQLSEIEYNAFGVITKVWYVYDARGNAIEIHHKIGNDIEELERANTSFLTSLVYYYNAPELRFFLEYIAMHGVYNNNVAEGRIYSSSTPGYNGITWYGDPTPNGPAHYSGFGFTGSDKLDPQTKLIIRYSADNDVDQYYYNCF